MHQILRVPCIHGFWLFPPIQKQNTTYFVRLLEYSTENYIEDETECVLNNYVYVCKERSG